MTRFYVDVLGLKPIYKSKKHVFLKVAEGFQGHTQVVALFNYKHDRNKTPPDSRRSTLHHIAFEIPLRSLATEKRRLRNAGLEISEEEHPQVHWRSIYFDDPEGNQIEFVSYDRQLT